ncbi:AtuA-related protein [Burkholderia stagnalis]
MKKIVPLREVASARTGDKGNVSCVSVWPYDPKHYEDIKASLTPERIAAAWPCLFRGKVERFEIPALHGLNFVIHDALEGGVNASLNLDFHGKSFSFLLLELPVELDER